MTMKKTIFMIATMIASIAVHAAWAAPLPVAKPDEVGFSQQGLARLDDFFAREIAAKRVPRFAPGPELKTATDNRGR